MKLRKCLFADHIEDDLSLSAGFLPAHQFWIGEQMAINLDAISRAHRLLQLGQLAKNSHFIDGQINFWKFSQDARLLYRLLDSGAVLNLQFDN